MPADRKCRSMHYEARGETCYRPHNARRKASRLSNCRFLLSLITGFSSTQFQLNPSLFHSVGLWLICLALTLLFSLNTSSPTAKFQLYSTAHFLILLVFSSRSLSSLYSLFSPLSTLL